WISVGRMGPSESAEPGRNLARFAAFVAMIVGVFVLAGWSFDMEQVTYVVPGWPRMVRLSALGFVLSGTTLWLICGGYRRVAMAGAALVAMLGLLVLLVHGSYLNVYLDQLSFAEIPAAVEGMAPSRMAPATALGFVALALSLFFAVPRKTALLHQALA